MLQDDVLPTIRETLILCSKSSTTEKERDENGKTVKSSKDERTQCQENIVRACLFVLRQFAFSDDMKDLFGLNPKTEVASTVLLVLKKHFGTLAIVEQAFGLFSNLTLRKPAISAALNKEPNRIVAIGQLVLQQPAVKLNPNVTKTVLSTLRNVAKAVPEAAAEMEDGDFFDTVRQIFFDHKDGIALLKAQNTAAAEKMEASKNSIRKALDGKEKRDLDAQKWVGTLDVAKQFLREFRQDDGVRAEAKWNEYY